MKLLVACRTLKGIGGTETFTYTLISELIRMGHSVEFFTLKKGLVSSKLEADGVKFMTSVNYDLIIASQNETVSELVKMNVCAPIIQIVHGIMTPGELPNKLANGYISISEEVYHGLKSKGFDSELVLNGIDCTRFKSVRKPRKNLKVIASLVQSDEAHNMVLQAAELVGNIQVIRLNKYNDLIWDVEAKINKADLVVSLGRGCYEAMACGRPVVIFDKRRYQDAKADGYLKPERFHDFVKNNCSGRFSNFNFSVEDLAYQFREYDNQDGIKLREIAVNELNISFQAEKIIDYASSVMNSFKYPGTTDVVYVLGKGSRWADNEIRYSIRSFVKHFKDLRNFVVVGQRPAWLKGVIHIPFEDNMNVNKDARMIQKIAAACSDSRVSDRFVFCTDDTFLNSDLCFDDFTGWHDGPIMYDAVADFLDHKNCSAENLHSVKPSRWFDYVYQTGRELQKRGLSDYNYDRSHCPQPIDKADFLSVIKKWDYTKHQYTCSNLYLNSTSVFTGENISGRNGKVYSSMPVAKLTDYLSDKIVFNVNDNGLNDVVKDYLQYLFPEPSKYELFASGKSRALMVKNWFSKLYSKNDDSSFSASNLFDEGLFIITSFAPKNRNLIKFLERKRGTNVAFLKLKNTLRLWLR